MPKNWRRMYDASLVKELDNICSHTQEDALSLLSEAKRRIFYATDEYASKAGFDMAIINRDALRAFAIVAAPFIAVYVSITSIPLIINGITAVFEPA